MVEIKSENFRRVNRDFFRIQDTNYYWFGGFGTVLYSFERGVRKNTIRFICGIPFEARCVERVTWMPWKPKKVHWTPPFFFTADWLHEFKRNLFNQLEH